MSDSPALAFPAGTGRHIRHTFLPVFLADSSSASRGHLEAERSEAIDQPRYLMSSWLQEHAARPTLLISC